ncbi:MAG: hypothetical protein HC857_11830 [Synechococcales cyanobacterium RU_4_20]|nr:hypothetical protein [Synechococcales cyanobacterium RU_4_20]NJR69568.1 hypothetical protein [Synechococcales cyanobacterium CRU_2_2]
MTDLTFIAAGVVAIAQPPTPDLPPPPRSTTIRPAANLSAGYRAASNLSAGYRAASMPGLQRQEDAWIALMAENTRPELSRLPEKTLSPVARQPQTPIRTVPQNHLQAATTTRSWAEQTPLPWAEGCGCEMSYSSSDWTPHRIPLRNRAWTTLRF